MLSGLSFPLRYTAIRAQQHTFSVHSGLTKGDIKTNFGQSERKLYKTAVIPIFRRFLKKSYSMFFYGFVVDLG